MTLHELLQSDVCLRLGWVLIHSLWQLALIGVVTAILLACYCFQADRRYVIAYVSLFLMAMVPVATCFVLPTPRALPAVAEAAVLPRFTDAPQSVSVENRGQMLPLPASVAGHEASSGNGRSLIERRRVRELTLGKSELTSMRFLTWLAPLWLAGVLGIAFRRLGGWLLALRIVRTSVPIENQEFVNRLVRLARGLGIRREVRVVQSALVTVPMVLGSLRPVVIVPVALITGLPPAQWDAILAHELAHIRRLDYVWNLLQIVIETLLFYHPAVWWLSRQIRVEREYCCDDLAAEHCGNALALAEGLAAIESSRVRAGAAPPFAITAVTPGRGDTLRRVRRILGVREDGDRAGASWLAGLLVILIVVIAGVVGQFGSRGVAVADPIDVPNEDPPKVDQPSAKSSRNEPKSWEVSRRYDPVWLRHYFMTHEVLPEPIEVPSVRGTVVDPDGELVMNAQIRSHTPRQWTRLHQGGQLTTQAHTPHTQTDRQGRYGLPARTEPYRVLVVHERGVASLTHEELINAQGRIVLQPWARIKGQYILDGEPQANQELRLYMNTFPWSYSTGGPRLTLDYTATTDDEGRFVLECVPPLKGRLHHVRGQFTRAAAIACEAGRTTHVELGRGRTIVGQLIAPVDAPGAWAGARVGLRQQRPNAPYPPGVSQDIQARNAWYREWLKTAEGQRYEDEVNHVINMDFAGDVDSGGKLRFLGIPKGNYYLTATYDKHFFRLGDLVVESDEGAPLDLGHKKLERPIDNSPVRSERGKNVHDSEDAPEPKSLPTLKVRVVDKQGQPIVNASVLLYDRNHYFAGVQVEFESRTRQTNDDGWAEFGRLPQDFVCVQVNGRQESFSTNYAVICEDVKGFKHTNPARPLVKIESRDDILTLVFTMRRSVNLTFDIVDAITGEAVDFPTVHYKDAALDRWWTIALLDAGGQHNFTSIVEELSDMELRAAATGYFPADFRLEEQLEIGREFSKRIELSPAPHVRFEVRTPSGQPASKARIKPITSGELRNFSTAVKMTNEQGAATMRFPAQGNETRFVITHPSGRFEIAARDFPKSGIVDDGGLPREMIVVRATLVK